MSSCPGHGGRQTRGAPAGLSSQSGESGMAKMANGVGVPRVKGLTGGGVNAAMTREVWMGLSEQQR